jgi:hypothetical protein
VIIVHLVMLFDQIPLAKIVKYYDILAQHEKKNEKKH